MRPAAYIIDFDSTIIKSESLEDLARLALRGNPDREAALRQLSDITNQGMAGTLPFEKSLRRRLKLFAARRELIDELASQLCLQFTPSALRNKEWFAAHAGQIYVISSGFEEWIIPVVAQLGITADHVFANAFTFDDDGATSGCNPTRPTSQTGGKIKQLAALRLPRPIIVIGDGYTDYEMAASGEADEFWAFCENIRRPSVIDCADRVLESFDMVVETSRAAVQ